MICGFTLRFGSVCSWFSLSHPSPFIKLIIIKANTNDTDRILIMNAMKHWASASLNAVGDHNPQKNHCWFVLHALMNKLFHPNDPLILSEMTIAIAMPTSNRTQCVNNQLKFGESDTLCWVIWLSVTHQLSGYSNTYLTLTTGNLGKNCHLTES